MYIIIGVLILILLVEHPTINAFAADIVDSVLSSVKQRFVDQPNTAISHTQKHSSSDNQVDYKNLC